MKKYLLASVLVSSTLLAQGYMAQGNKISKDLLKELGSNLKKELKSNGAVSALRFCNINAENLTKKIDNKYGKTISVKRISLKPRNHKNKPSKDERVVLKAMENMYSVGVKPKNVLQMKDDRVVFYKPLIIKKKACLICHSTVNKDSKIAKEINKLYPKDKATGYKMNDLRGAIVVTMPKVKK